MSWASLLVHTGWLDEGSAVAHLIFVLGFCPMNELTRCIADRLLLAIPASCMQVAAYNPNYVVELHFFSLYEPDITQHKPNPNTRYETDFQCSCYVAFYIHTLVAV